MNILFEEQPKGTTHFFRYASGYIVWCKVEDGQNNQPIIKEWDSGNEYWVPGIYPIEHYQKIGLTSIDDLPTQNDVGPDAATPKGATHRYQHGGETGWYRETEDNLLVWRDGSWYSSTQKSAKDLARVCPFGAVTILTQEVQLAEDGEDALTWLARNVHEWPAGEHQPWCYVGTGCHDKVRVASGTSLGISPTGRVRITRDQWLARRAELQGKPSWSDAPEWAQWLGQNTNGCWAFLESDTFANEWGGWSQDKKDGRRKHDHLLWSGEVLGDWRDTLERRPVDLSEPAGGVKERGADGAEENNAMAQRLLVALKSEPHSFDTGALAEIVELADAEIVKRDAKVCGGEGYLNNHWFERGELPPVGVECEFIRSADVEWPTELVDGCRVTVISHYSPYGDDEMVAVFAYKARPDGFRMVGQGRRNLFRPIRTERELAIDEMVIVSGLRARDGAREVMGNLYDAGYRKETK